MKLDGKNIIADTDVTVLNKNATLSDVLKQQDDDIARLKSNVKWLYKYGGVGSGSGGGGSSSNRWYILIDINGTAFQATSSDEGAVTTGNLILNGEGSYPINIQVVRPGGGSFSARITYYNGATVSVSDKLTTDNEWVISRNITIAGNNMISVRVTDGEFTAIANISYISSPYYFKLELADNDSKNVWSGNGDDMFINEIQENGLSAKFSYDIGVEVAMDDEGNKNGVTYTTTDILGNVSETKILDLSEGTTGSIMLDLINDPNFLTDNANAATYTFGIDIQVVTNSGGLTSHESYQVTFNLIPSSLYLKIVPDTGTLYTVPQANPGYVYTAGPKSFVATPYFGLNEGKQITVSAYLDSTPDEITADLLKPIPTLHPVFDPYMVAERSPISGIVIDMSALPTDEWTEHILTFRAICGTTVAYFVYYAYAKELSTDLQWYPSNVAPSKQNYWRSQQDTVGMPNWPTTSGILSVSTQDSDKTVVCSNISDTADDLLFSFGILYSEINSNDSPIISLEAQVEGASDEKYINIYPNEITLAGSASTKGTTQNCYIPRTKYADYTSNSEDYHLITIYRRILRRTTKSNYYEITVYVDGILDTTFKQWYTTSPRYTNIIFHPGNYFINHCELSYFSHNINADGSHLNYLNDGNIVRYWYTYQAKKLNKLDFPMNSLAAFESSMTLSDTPAYLNLPKTTKAAIQDIAGSTTAPIILFKTQDTKGATTFLDWYTHAYSEEDVIEKRAVTLEYAGVNDDGTVPVYVTGCQFYISVQGSTTRGYRCKNFELSIENNSADTSLQYLFSPNFSNTDKNTYLPETSFTLKADAVDSSHSNNTTMGEFINANCTRFADMMADSNQSGPYKDYVKNCLCGFGCLVFAEVTSPDETVDIYYLGVYNFNLGRNASFNLGYINTNGLTHAQAISDSQTLPKGLQEGFHIYTLETSYCTINPDVLACEIAHNGNYYDFSQYDPSILLPNPETDQAGKVIDQGGMFGDIKTSISATVYTGMLEKMVECVAKAGGYIFGKLKKTFGTHIAGYSSADAAGNSLNTVPDYKTQYTRQYDSGTDTYIKKADIPASTISDLDECINPFADMYYDNPDNLVPRIDYQSLVEYYTICMVFGLFDSVQKNLTMRTFNSRRFYLAFYDMDTCLGVDNAGNDADYFAFSDYWLSSDTDIEKDDGSIIKRPSVVSIFRDFCYENVKGFDIPSTYLFAIAKYSYMFNNTGGMDEQFSHPADDQVVMTFPSELWATWRSKGGLLENAEKFVDEYYKHHMSNIDECMFNYNYRAKYFVGAGTNDYNNPESQLTYDETNMSKFKGRRLEYVRQWLDGRFHILDAYFNLPNTNSPITYRKDDGTWDTVTTPSGYVLRDPTINDTLKANVNANDDVYVVHSIFGEQQRWNSTISLNVKSTDYSPLFAIPSGGNISRFLLTDADQEYNVYIPATGYNAYNMGGSSAWTWLENINPIDGQCAITSSKLKNLTGTAGSINSFSILMPAVETIELTSPNYSGNLALVSTTMLYPNLGTVTLNNSAINLTVNGQDSFRTLNFTNAKQGASVAITNCKNFQTCNLSGTFNSIQLTNIAFDIKWNTVKSNSIIISTNDYTKTFTLENDTNVTYIELSGFASVNISNCNKLKSVTITGGKTTNISIIPAAGNRILETCNIDPTSLTTLDLSNNNNLKTITFANADPSKVTSLNLKATAVSSIKYKDSEASAAYLDLTRFTAMTSFNIQNNSTVTHIQFINNLTKPFDITNTFTGCINLERIYGHVCIKCSSCFKSLPKFSVKGADITTVTHNNTAVYNSAQKLCKPIWEICNDPENKLTIDLNKWFESGLQKTNMYIVGNNGDASSTFYQTTITEYDIYYILYRAESLTNMSTMFQSSVAGTIWNPKVNGLNNNFNRFALARCTNVTNMSAAFRSLYEGPILIYSPEFDEDGNVIKIGTLTPITKVVTLQHPWLGSATIIDRNVFNHDHSATKTTNFALQELSYFTVANIVENVNIASAITINNVITAANNTGNITGLFSRLPNLKRLYNSFHGISHIDYPETGFLIPDTMERMVNCFRSSTASGTFNFPNFFKATGTSQLWDLRGAFIVGTTNDSTPELEIDNNLFSRTKNLKYIGHYDGADDSTSDERYLGDATSGIGSLAYCTFNGFNKKLDSFPETLLYNLPNLMQFSGLFYNIKPTGFTTVTDPFDMFKNNTKLKSLAGAFAQFFVNFSFTKENPLENFISLTNIDYLFSKGSGSDRLNYSLGTLPLKFLNTGSIQRTVTIQGCYESDLTVNDDGITVFPASANAKTVTFTYTNYNRTVKYFRHTFEGNMIRPYTHTITEDDVEWNPDYNPFDYIYSGNSWTKNKVKDTRKFQFYYAYDGRNEAGNTVSEIITSLRTKTMPDGQVHPALSVSDFVIPDDMEVATNSTPVTDLAKYGNKTTDNNGWQTQCDTGVQRISNFFCPPDLFRYATANAELSYCFAYNSRLQVYSYGDYPETSKFRDSGMFGRYCPYLLKGLTTAKNAQYMFAYVKSLVGYKSKDGNNYLIPPSFFSYAPGLTELEGMFQYTMIPATCTLTGVFKGFNSGINVAYIFYKAIMPEVVTSVFTQCTVTNCQYAFACCSSSEKGVISAGIMYNQNVTFNTVFKNLTAYTGNTAYQYVFFGYGSGYVTHESTKTLSSAVNDNNYTYFNA